MANPTIAGTTVTLLEVIEGEFSAEISDETLDSGLADVIPLGAKASYITLGGTIPVRNDLFTMAAVLDVSRENKTTIAVANADPTLDGNYYVQRFNYKPKGTSWNFTLQIVKAAF